MPDSMVPGSIYHAAEGRLALLVVGPHPQDVNDALIRQDLVDEAVLDVDPSRVAAGKVADQLLVPRRVANGSSARTASRVWALSFSPDEASFSASFWAWRE